MSRKNAPCSTPESTPEWYWPAGLHDAVITEVESFEFPLDYARFDGPKNQENRNLLRLKINSKEARDTSVKEIYFYNYKILTPDIPLKNRKAIWWLSDRLVAYDKSFVLQIELEDYDSSPENFTFKIAFESAEVLRS